MKRIVSCHGVKVSNKILGLCEYHDIRSRFIHGKGDELYFELKKRRSTGLDIFNEIVNAANGPESSLRITRLVKRVEAEKEKRRKLDEQLQALRQPIESEQMKGDGADQEVLGKLYAKRDALIDEIANVGNE